MSDGVDFCSVEL